MKKIMIMIVLCLVCLTLCACGGIPGTEAAEMFPDIIGDWGRDPFGEEFVLSLSKDGSCSLLGNPGEWFLDPEGSSDKQVQLTVKTEHGEYLVQLGRLLRSNSDFADLLITDAKEKITVYDLPVFLPGTVYLSPEAALPAVPEMIGEWGSLYFYEEPALTVREDGSCTLLRQPGRWCLFRHEAVWPHLRICIELDNGEQFTCLLANYAYPEPAYRHDMFIENNGDVVYPENYKDGIIDMYTGFTIDRTKPLPGEEWIPLILGTWVDGESGKDAATFREDGTCTVFGKEAVWGVDWWNYEHVKKNDIPGSYWYVVKIEGECYQISVNDYGNGQYKMTIHGDLQNYTDIIKIDRN